MAFAIEISEVGPAEYPLMQVLRDTVFGGEFGFVSRSPLADRLSSQVDVYMLMAHLEGNPLGFAIGCRRTVFDYYINFVAVLREYRHEGVGKQFMQRLESFSQAAGYERIEFNTQNRFRDMMRLGLKLGYQPCGLEQHDGTLGDLQIRFGKTFAKAAPVDQRLLTAIEAGDEIAGLMRESSGGLKVILASERP